MTAHAIAHSRLFLIGVREYYVFGGTSRKKIGKSHQANARQKKEI